MLIVITGRLPVSSRNPRRNMAFRHLAEAADKLHIPLVFSTPTECNSFHRGIHGWEVKLSEMTQGRNMWKRVNTATGAGIVIYDAMYLEDLIHHRDAYKRLLRRIRRDKIPCFNPILPSKDIVYRRLEHRQLMAGRIPYTVYGVSSLDVIRILEQRTSVWLKPVLGSGGRNIIYVEQAAKGTYKVSAERFHDTSVNEIMDKPALKRFLRKAFEKKRYMAQEHLDLVRTNDGRRVDFRVTTQRNETGRWDVVAITGRFGAPGAHLTNFHAGGSIESLTEPREERRFLLRQIGMTEVDIERMRQFGVSIARTLGAVHPNLGILGVDVGRTTTGELYAYDFNGRPGRDILTDSEVAVSMRMVAGFAHYLHRSTLKH